MRRHGGSQSAAAAAADGQTASAQRFAHSCCHRYDCAQSCDHGRDCVQSLCHGVICAQSLDHGNDWLCWQYGEEEQCAKPAGHVQLACMPSYA